MLTNVRGAGRAILTVSLVVLAACQGKGAPPRISADSTAYYRDQVASLTTVSAQKDSLMLELSETTKLFTDVSAELATIRTAKPTAPVVAGEGVKTHARAEMLAQVRQLTTRVKENEQRLAASRRRVEQLSGTNDSLRTALAAYANTITELQGVVESQKETPLAVWERSTRDEERPDGVRFAHGASTARAIRPGSIIAPTPLTRATSYPAKTGSRTVA